MLSRNVRSASIWHGQYLQRAALFCYLQHGLVYEGGGVCNRTFIYALRLTLSAHVLPFEQTPMKTATYLTAAAVCLMAAPAIAEGADQHKWQQECNQGCNSHTNKHRVTILAAKCETYRYVMPRPKMYSKCKESFDTAMHGLCGKACSGKLPGNAAENESSQYCSSAKNDMPRPTAHKACQDGFRAGFQAAMAFAKEMQALHPIETTESKAAAAAAAAAETVKAAAAAAAKTAGDAAAAKVVTDAAAATAAAAKAAEEAAKPSAKDELQAAKEAARKAYLEAKTKREADADGGLDL